MPFQQRIGRPEFGEDFVFGHRRSGQRETSG
jgi:hypothetical protein